MQHNEFDIKSAYCTLVFFELPPFSYPWQPTKLKQKARIFHWSAFKFKALNKQYSYLQTQPDLTSKV